MKSAMAAMARTMKAVTAMPSSVPAQAFPANIQKMDMTASQQAAEIAFCMENDYGRF